MAHDNLHIAPTTGKPSGRCLCVCPACFHTWWYERPDGTRAFVGICICRYCPCDQRQVSERNRFASVLR